jgi:glycosyltransferase involved in cell wall biosynthesis
MARRYDAVIVEGSTGARQGYVDLIAAAIVARLRHGPAVVITDCTWKSGSSWLDRQLNQIGIRILDTPKTTYCVLSRDEVATFPRTWGVDGSRVAFTPWPYTIGLQDSEAAGTADGTVFAGGDSLRDYEPLIAAAAGLPAEVAIATRRRDVIERIDLPPNVRAGPVTHERYVELMRRATVVVVAMADTKDRSSGQTTYVNAMAMGKLVVTPDTLGIRDYIDDRVTGLLVPPGDVGTLRDTLRWAVDPANAGEVRSIGERARRAALERFTPDGYVENLLAVARAAADRLNGP